MMYVAMASNFYRSKDSPRYILGHALELGFCGTGLLAVLILRFGYRKVNRKRDTMGSTQLTEAELSELGDKAPTFRYVW